MNRNQLFALFDRVADVPDAVGRLRRFVLDLAVRGKLVKQDPAEEPANELLKRITDEAERHSEIGKQRRRKDSRLQMASPPFELPHTWCWASLGTVFQYDAGMNCDPKHLDPSAWLLELQDVEKGTGRLLNRVQTGEREPKSTKSQFSIGDILYGKLRPYLNKVLVADRGGYSTTEIVAIRPYLRLSSEYCALALRRPDFVQYVTRLGQGTKMPRLRTKDAVVAPFPLPPLAEQYRIVAKVDKLTALCDQLGEMCTAREKIRDRLTKATLTRISTPDTNGALFRAHTRFAIDAIPALTARADQIKDLRQSILNLAVRGKLVKQNPEDEPASELLRRIVTYQKSLLSAGRIKLTKVNPIASRESPFDIPNNWQWTRLGNIGDWGAGSTPSRGNADFFGGNTTWLKSGELNDNRHLRDSEETITQLALDRCSFRMNRPGDVLIAMYGATIGKLAILTESAVTNQAVCGCTPFPGVLSDFLFLFLLSQRSTFQKSSEGGAQPNISKVKIVATPFPLPPLAEQHQIVEKVDGLMALCDQLEEACRAREDSRIHLLEILLHDTLPSSVNEHTQLKSFGNKTSKQHGYLNHLKSHTTPNGI